MECFPNHEPFDIPHPARLIQQLNCGFSTSATSPTSRASTSLRPMVWVQSKLSLSSTSIRYHLCGDEQNELDKDGATVKRVVTAVESELNNGVLHPTSYSHFSLVLKFYDRYQQQIPPCGRSVKRGICSFYSNSPCLCDTTNWLLLCATHIDATVSSLPLFATQH